MGCASLTASPKFDYMYSTTISRRPNTSPWGNSEHGNELAKQSPMEKKTLCYRTAITCGPNVGDPALLAGVLERATGLPARILGHTGLPTCGVWTREVFLVYWDLGRWFDLITIQKEKIGWGIHGGCVIIVLDHLTAGLKQKPAEVTMAVCAPL